MQLLERSFDATHEEPAAAAGAPSRPAVVRQVVLAADRRSLLSDEHFTVDGTLIEAAASLKSFSPRSPGLGDFHTGAPTPRTRARDPEARLFRKGKGRKAGVHGPCADGEPQRPALLSEATGTAERDAVPVLLAFPRTLGGDKGYHAGLRLRTR